MRLSGVPGLRAFCCLWGLTTPIKKVRKRSLKFMQFCLAFLLRLPAASPGARVGSLLRDSLLGSKRAGNSGFDLHQSAAAATNAISEQGLLTAIRAGFCSPLSYTARMHGKGSRPVDSAESTPKQGGTYNLCVIHTSACITYRAPKNRRELGNIDQ